MKNTAADTTDPASLQPAVPTSDSQSLRDRLRELPPNVNGTVTGAPPNQRIVARSNRGTNDSTVPVARVPDPPKKYQTGNGKTSEAVQSGRIMIVDDEESNILTVKAYLRKAGYHDVVSTVDSRRAVEAIREHKPAVLLLDIKMPHTTGIEILRMLMADPIMRRISTIILTASIDPQIKQQALELGANDFLTKPVDPHDLIPRVRNALVIKSHFDEMADQNARLEHLVQRRTEELFNSRQQLILSLARAAEHRDDDTGNHVIRVGRYSGIIATEIGWSDQRVQMIEQAAQLHDVGKIGIPDSILFKPGPLEDDEWRLMKKHCAMGVDIIEPHSGRELHLLRSHTSIGAEILRIRNSPMMMMATRIAQTHHERWDGTGYPLGLEGEDIPIEGRITAVADVFDALSSERPYKVPFPRNKCFSIMKDGRGTHFDPSVLDAFFRRAEEIVNVQLTLMDGS